MACKQCGAKGGGHNFCTRKCRAIWVKEHDVHKMSKKQREARHDRFLSSFGSDFSNENNCQNDTRED